MKTSLVLVILIILNTSALLSEPLAQLVNGIDSWMLVAFEVVLLIIYYVHHVIKGLSTIGQIDFDGIELFVVKPKDKTQGKP